MSAPSLPHLGEAACAGPAEAAGSAGFPRRLLAPLDLSAESALQLRSAVAWAELLRLPLSVVHVLEPEIATLDGAWLLPTPGERLAAAQQKVAELLRQIAGSSRAAGISARVCPGTPVAQICQELQHCGADLLTITTHGYAGVKRLLLGGLADALVRKAPVPVLVSRLEPTGSLPPARLRRMLVPVDFSPRSEQAITYAVQLARRTGSAISLAHVLDVADLDLAENWTGDFAAMAAHGHARLRSLTQRLIPMAYQGPTFFEKGVAFAKINALMQKAEADLLVITTHGRTGLAHLLLGSTAERILHHCPHPVLVVRA